MSCCPAKERSNNVSVGMGEATLARDPTRLTAILGSCVAMAIYAPELRLGMLSHVMLPHANGDKTYAGKFADTALSHMLSVLDAHGAKRRGLVAKIAGGACILGGGRFMKIGEANLQASLEALKQANISLVGSDVAGTFGRRISFDLATGCMTVEAMGRPAQVI
jgi:chemotaxis protein CheD